MLRRIVRMTRFFRKNCDVVVDVPIGTTSEQMETIAVKLEAMDDLQWIDDTDDWHKTEHYWQPCDAGLAIDSPPVEIVFGDDLSVKEPIKAPELKSGDTIIKEVELAFCDLWEFNADCSLEDFMQILNEKATGCGGHTLTSICHEIIGAKDGKAIVRVSGEIL